MNDQPLRVPPGESLRRSRRATHRGAWRAVWATALVSVVPVGLSGQTPAEQPPPAPPGLVFSEEVAVEWVTVPVTLVEGPAKPVAGRVVLGGGSDPGGAAGSGAAVRSLLEEDDFELRVDGRLVDLQSFDHGEAPFGLLYAQDLSGSMAHGDKLRLSRNTLALLLARTGELDEVGVVTFAGPTVEVQVPFTSELATLDEASARWRAYGTTALYDALAKVAELAKESHRSRRAVVLVSDGIDNASTIAADQARSLLQGAGLPVFVLDVAARFERSAPAPVAVDLPVDTGDDPVAFSLAGLATATGGRYLDVGDHAAVQSATDQVMRDLRQQYLLGFTTDSAIPAAWHRIEVAVRAEADDKNDKKAPAPQLRYRTRYFGSPPASWSESAAATAASPDVLTERRRSRRGERPRPAVAPSRLE